ncbi:MAG: response regulator [Anaerolineae bacterium]
MSNIKVMIVDDQALARDGLELIVSASADIDVVATAEDGAQALEKLAQAEVRPDVILMDLKMPILNGVQTTRKVITDYPDCRVLVLTTYDADEWVVDAIRAGASGYLLKDSPREEIIAAIKKTVAGETTISPRVTETLYRVVKDGVPKDTSIAQDLNEREREILQLLANGLSNADIATRVHLAEGTVRNYVSSIFAKLGVSDRTQAAAIAWRHGLVSAE